MKKTRMVLATWAAVWSVAVMAQTKISVELPSQALSKALSTLARQSGVDLIAPAGLVANRTAPTVKGRMTVREAFDRLLQGTALAVEQRDDKTYVIVSSKPSVPESRALSDATVVLPMMVVTSQSDPDIRGFVAESTSSATRTNTPLIEIPQSIQVVTQEVLKSQQAQSVADALRNVSGVEIQGNSGSVASSGSPVINGFPANVTLNGITNSDALKLPMAAIARVEVLKGADMMVSGEGAPGGTVNVVTKIPQFAPFNEFSFQTGSYGDLLGSVDLTGPITSDKQLSYRFIVSGERAAGSYGGFQGKRDFYIAPSLRWKDSSTDLVVGLEQQHTQFPSNLYGMIMPDGRVSAISLNRRAYSSSSNTSVYYNLSREIRRNLTFRSTAKYTASTYRDTPDVYLDRSENEEFYHSQYRSGDHSNSYYIDLDNSIDLRIMTGEVTQEMLAGYAYSLSRSHASSSFEGRIVSPFPSVDNPILADVESHSSDFYNSCYGNLYLQDQISWRRLHVLMSLTRGQPGGLGWSPNVGVAYQISDNWAIFANEQHSLMPNEGSFLANRVPAPPTRSQSIEAGVKFELLHDRLSGAVAIHRSRYQNILIGMPGRDYSILVPNGQTARGMTMDVSGEVIRGLKIISSYSYNDYSVSTQEAALGNYVGSAKHSGSLWATYDFQSADLHGWGMGAGIYTRGRYSAQTIADNTVSMPGQARVDGSVYYHRKRWSSTLGVKNIFGRRLYDDGAGTFVGIQPGRTFYLTSSVNF
ncbi:TonB-dependent receptor (plasmid) [Burkholderia sp. FERM BP-3421]|uniref:TonB-dependent siderophore receptor n=1 Tax=Burkholderia sp. FERM BP-3421 TaxID=1494466 RepID=UPI00235DC87B|nr:TonB-dependent receptor [Burkholderia sp. FERM BP-3421]WDD90356.1 TonB-dependent receptor [Burkholderia sp. FERM BP-3421]